MKSKLPLTPAMQRALADPRNKDPRLFAPDQYDPVTGAPLGDFEIEPGWHMDRDQRRALRQAEAEWIDQLLTIDEEDESGTA